MKQVYVEDESKRKQLQHELCLMNTFNTKPLLRDRSAEEFLTHRQESSGNDGEGPCVLQLHDAYTESDERCVCLVLEFMDGGALDKFVKQVLKALRLKPLLSG